MNNEHTPEYFCIASKIFHDRVNVTGALMPDFILETTFTNIRPEQPVTTKLFAPLKTSLSKLFVCSNIIENCIRKYNRIGESLPKGDGCSGCHNAPIILSIIHGSHYPSSYSYSYSSYTSNHCKCSKMHTIANCLQKCMHRKSAQKS